MKKNAILRHMRYKIFIKFLSVIICPLFFSVNCKNKGPAIKHEELFTLNLGVMADELDYFERDGTLFFDKKIEILMRDGLFYITNPSLGKVMKFSNYGDILSLIYNEENNLPFKKNDLGFRVTAWNFQNIGSIAVDEEGYIYIDDRIEIDADLPGPVALDRVILRFDNNGEYIDFLGQEGKNSSPLPFITTLKTTKNGLLTAVARDQEFWKIYVYNRRGESEFPVITLSSALTYPEADPDITFRITGITPDANGNFLYISAAGLTKTKTEVLPRMFVYSIKENKIIRSFLFPLGKSGEGFTLIGSDLMKNLYFTRDLVKNGEQTGYELQVLDHEGALIRSATLTHQMKEPPISTSISVSDDGIIYALFSYSFGAEVVWWRPA